jgi:N-acetyl-alpha-D-glucosaminyl L-malate synthase BshA
MTMGTERALRIGSTCYPSVGGSGILASALGEELARRGHEAHFISYERPFRLPHGAPGIFYHPVAISSYGLFKYPDYTLPLSVKMAEVSRDCGLDVLHVHYAVPHATAAILAQSMLPPETRPRVVTTLHGTDTTLLGRDAGYGPAIAFALERSDAVTTVSAFLEQETRQLMDIRRPIEVIHNFFEPHEPRRSREEVRRCCCTRRTCAPSSASTSSSSARRASGPAIPSSCLSSRAPTFHPSWATSGGSSWRTGSSCART